MNSIGDIIKEYREKANISQRELGRRIEMSGQMISKIEKNETTPSSETIFKIANELGIPGDKIKIYMKSPLTDALLKILKKPMKDLALEIVQKTRESTIDEIYDNGPVFESFDVYKNDIFKYWKDVVTWYPLDEFNNVDLNKLDDAEMNEIAKALEITFNLKITEIKNRREKEKYNTP